MNPQAENLDPGGFPPLSEVRRDFRVDWYRCPIPRDKLRALSQPNDRRGLCQALGHLTAWLLTGAVSWYLYEAQIWWAFAITLFVHGTIASFLTAPHHELCHSTVFRTKKLNEVFLRLFSLLGWQNFKVYRFSHSYHHRFTLHPIGDREEVMPASPSLRALYLLQLFTLNIMGGYQSRGLIPTLKNFLYLAFDRFHNPFNSWGEELYAEHPRDRAEAANWARIVLAFHGLVILTACSAGHPIVALLVSGGVFIANAHRYFVGVPMHCGLKSNNADFRKCVRTIRLDPLSEFFYWYMNWHIEHHMYAAIPCYNLSKLYETVASDMPTPRTLLGAWAEMRVTWHRQQTDPDHAFDTPIPSASTDNDADSSDENLASSMGGLAPRAIA